MDRMCAAKGCDVVTNPHFAEQAATRYRCFHQRTHHTGNTRPCDTRALRARQVCALLAPHASRPPCWSATSCRERRCAPLRCSPSSACSSGSRALSPASRDCLAALSHFDASSLSALNALPRCIPSCYTHLQHSCLSSSAWSVCPGSYWLSTILSRTRRVHKALQSATTVLSLRIHSCGCACTGW